MAVQQREIIVKEPLFIICGKRYLEALLLERFMRGDFREFRKYTVEDLCRDVFLDNSSNTTVKNALKRLLDKGYIKVNIPSGTTRQSSQWHVCLDVIKRDVERHERKPDITNPHAAKAA